jgi:hypothetical protein
MPFDGRRAMTVSRRKALVPVALWIAAFGGAAQAAQVYQGDDVSYGWDSNRRLVVCDREADGRGVHADGYSFAGGYIRVDDLDGYGGACYESNSMSSGLSSHRTVEEINNWPDAKSGWSYH